VQSVATVAALTGVRGHDLGVRVGLGGAGSEWPLCSRVWWRARHVMQLWVPSQSRRGIMYSPEVKHQHKYICTSSLYFYFIISTVQDHGRRSTALALSSRSTSAPPTIGRVWQRWERDREQWAASYNNNHLFLELTWMI